MGKGHITFSNERPDGYDGAVTDSLVRSTFFLFSRYEYIVLERVCMDWGWGVSGLNRICGWVFAYVGVSSFSKKENQSEHSKDSRYSSTSPRLGYMHIHDLLIIIPFLYVLTARLAGSRPS